MNLRGNETELAVELVQLYEMSYSDALDFVLEAGSDKMDKAAKKMAAKVKDPEKRAAAEKKFKANMEKFAAKKKDD